jgi:hypothetical protein
MSPVLNSGAFFDVDVSEVQKFGYVLKGSQARGIINKELHDAGQRSGSVVRQKANALTNRRTGRLIETSTVHTSLNSSAITTTVTWPAKSPRGFRLPLRRQLWPRSGRRQGGRRLALRGWRHSPVPQVGRPGQSAALR